TAHPAPSVLRNRCLNSLKSPFQRPLRFRSRSARSTPGLAHPLYQTEGTSTCQQLLHTTHSPRFQANHSRSSSETHLIGVTPSRSVWSAAFPVCPPLFHHSRCSSRTPPPALPLLPLDYLLQSTSAPTLLAIRLDSVVP